MSCVFWQHDRLVTDERHKDAWAESFGRRHGAFGRVLRDGDGVPRHGPVRARRRVPARPGPAGRARPSRDAALVTCTFLEGEDPRGSCERLLLEALADLKVRGDGAPSRPSRLDYPDEVPVDERFLGHHTLFDRDFLEGLGFVPVRATGPGGADAHRPRRPGRRPRALGCAARDRPRCAGPPTPPPRGRRPPEQPARSRWAAARARPRPRVAGRRGARRRPGRTRPCASRDAYVSPRVAGRRRRRRPSSALAAAAERLDAAGPPGEARRRGRPGRRARRCGSTCARSPARLALRGHARRHRPRARVAAAGPRVRGRDHARRCARPGVRGSPNPVDRLARPPASPRRRARPRTRQRPHGADACSRSAVLGGAGRSRSASGAASGAARREVAEARAAHRICLDALRARATALVRRDDLAAAGPRARGARPRHLRRRGLLAPGDAAAWAQVDALGPGRSTRAWTRSPGRPRAWASACPATTPSPASARWTRRHGPAPDDRRACARTATRRPARGEPAPAADAGRRTGAPVPFDAGAPTGRCCVPREAAVSGLTASPS